eukprot:5394363-Amphidinium_carterae.1
MCFACSGIAFAKSNAPSKWRSTAATHRRYCAGVGAVGTPVPSGSFSDEEGPMSETADIPAIDGPLRSIALWPPQRQPSVPPLEARCVAEQLGASCRKMRSRQA